MYAILTSGSLGLSQSPFFETIDAMAMFPKKMVANNNARHHPVKSVKLFMICARFFFVVVVVLVLVLVLVLVVVVLVVLVVLVVVVLVVVVVLSIQLIIQDHPTSNAPEDGSPKLWPVGSVDPEKVLHQGLHGLNCSWSLHLLIISKWVR